MRWIGHLSLVAKGLLVVAVMALGLAAVGVTAVMQLREADRQVTRALSEHAQATIAAVRLHGYVRELGRSARGLLLDPSPEATKRALDAHASARKGAESRIAEIRGWRPEWRATVEDASQRIATLDAVARRAAQQPDPAARAALLAAEYEKPVAALLSDLSRLQRVGRDLLQTDREGVAALLDRAAVLLPAIGLAMLLLAGLASTLLFTRTVSRPVRRLADAMERMAAGELDLALPEAARRDEIGLIARTLDRFRVQLLERRRLEAEAAADRATRDRRQQDTESFTADFASSLGGVATSLAEGSERILADAAMVRDAADRARDTARTLAGDAARSASSLEAVSGAADRMGVSITEVTRRMEEASARVAEAVAATEEADARAAGFRRAAEEIGQVLTLISDIAGKTNLLALNATIEAARAGEAGKGFAVVASEVKGLAAQTARATGDIGERIESLRRSSAEIGAALQQISGTVGSVHSVAADVAAAVEDQARLTREIAGHVSDVASVTGAVSANMAQVEQDADASRSASVAVIGAAEGLRGQARSIGGELDAFIGQLKRGGERRRYDRHPLRRPARLVFAQVEHPTETIDLSRHSLAVKGDWPIPLGSDVTVRMDGSDLALRGRVSRVEGGRIALVLRDDAATIAGVDALLRGVPQAA